MQNREISDDTITPEFDAVSGDPTQARLNDPSGNVWTPTDVNHAKMIIDLVSRRRVLGMDAHGNRDANTPGYPTKFKVEYRLLPSDPWTIARTVSTRFQFFHYPKWPRSIEKNSAKFHFAMKKRTASN